MASQPPSPDVPAQAPVDVPVPSPSDPIPSSPSDPVQLPGDGDFA